MAAINEVARLTVEAIQRNVHKTFNQVGSAVGKLQKNVKGFNNVMAMNMDVFRAVNKGGAQFTSAGAKLSNRFRMLTHGARGFRMEMLGVMFFGMMIQRTFMNLLKPGMELFGFFELFRVTLQVLFLPLMEQLLPYFLDLMTYLMDLSPTTKKVVGWFVLFAMILGTIIFLIGSVTLGLGSMAIAFGGLAGFGAIIGTIATVLGIVIAMIVIAAVVWKKNLGNIREHTRKTWDRMKNLIKETMGGIAKIIIGVWEFVRLILTGKWKAAWDKIKEIGSNAVEFIKNLGKTLIHAFLDPLILKLNMVIDLFNRISGKNIPLISTGFLEPTMPTTTTTTATTPLGAGNNITYAPETNINVIDYAEVERIIAEDHKKVVDELSRLTGTI